MAQVAKQIAGAQGTAPFTLALGLFICGFGLKAALVPFHAWLPDAHPSAPAPISAMLSGVLIKAIGVYVLARLLFNVFGAPPQVLFLLRILGMTSMVVGALLSIGQWDMKRLFAYSSISQVGYIILGLGIPAVKVAGVMVPIGAIGALYHLMNHSVFKSLLFLNAGAVEYATGTRDMKQMGGLSRRMPVTGATSLVGSMSIAGIPPFNGFWSKLIIILACVMAGYYWLAFAAVAVSVLTLAILLKVQKHAFFGEPATSFTDIQRVPVLMATSMIVLAILCVAMAFLAVRGLYEPLIVQPAADVLARLTGAITG
jgi:multicomponent Na+:H+ antiporter subunit D